jgi:hypothetical protein
MPKKNRDELSVWSSEPQLAPAHYANLPILEEPMNRGGLRMSRSFDPEILDEYRNRFNTGEKIFRVRVWKINTHNFTAGDWRLLQFVSDFQSLWKSGATMRDVRERWRATEDYHRRNSAWARVHMLDNDTTRSGLPLLPPDVVRRIGRQSLLEPSWRLQPRVRDPYLWEPRA